MSKNHSIYDSLTRKFFPNDAPWQRRKKMKMLLLAVTLGVLVGGGIILFAWLQNSKQVVQ